MRSLCRLKCGILDRFELAKKISQKLGRDMHRPKIAALPFFMFSNILQKPLVSEIFHTYNTEYPPMTIQTVTVNRISQQRMCIGRIRLSQHVLRTKPSFSITPKIIVRISLDLLSTVELVVRIDLMYNICFLNRVRVIIMITITIIITIAIINV